MLKICMIMLTVGLPTTVDEASGAVLETENYDEEYHYTLPETTSERNAALACATKAQNLRFDRMEAGAAHVYWNWDVAESTWLLPGNNGALTSGCEESASPKAASAIPGLCIADNENPICHAAPQYAAPCIRGTTDPACSVNPLTDHLEEDGE